MTTSLGKRSSVNGISDIAYSDEKAPIYTSTDQFVQGTKTFSAPAKFLNNVLCSGYYYGDGSHLTNVTGLDPSKLPLTGGTLTGALNVVRPNQSIEISEIGVRTSIPGNGTTATMKNSEIKINDANIGEYVKFDKTNLTYNPPGGAASSRTWADIVNPNTGIPTLDQVLSVGNSSSGNIILTDGSGATTNMTPSTLYVTSPTSSLSVNSTQIEILDGSGSGNTMYIINDSSQSYIDMANPSMNFRAVLAPNQLSLNEISTGTGVVSYGNDEIRIKDVNRDFFFRSAAGRFFKWESAQAFTVDRNESHVEVWHSFKVSEGGVPFNFNSFNNYLDTNGKDGWSVILSNSDGADIALNSPDITFYSHATGSGSLSIPLKKWATARCTLVELPSYPMGYAWAVSMY